MVCYTHGESESSLWGSKRWVAATSTILFFFLCIVLILWYLDVVRLCLCISLWCVPWFVRCPRCSTAQGERCLAKSRDVRCCWPSLLFQATRTWSLMLPHVLQILHVHVPRAHIVDQSGSVETSLYLVLFFGCVFFLALPSHVVATSYTMRWSACNKNKTKKSCIFVPLLQAPVFSIFPASSLKPSADAFEKVCSRQRRNPSPCLLLQRAAEERRRAARSARRWDTWGLSGKVKQSKWGRGHICAQHGTGVGEGGSRKLMPDHMALSGNRWRSWTGSVIRNC